MSFSTSRSFCLHGLLVRNDADVEQGGIWADCSNTLRPLVLSHVPHFAKRVPCKFALEIVFFGNSGFEIGECVFGVDFGCDDAALC